MSYNEVIFLNWVILFIVLRVAQFLKTNKQKPETDLSLVLQFRVFRYYRSCCEEQICKIIHLFMEEANYYWVPRVYTQHCVRFRGHSKRVHSYNSLLNICNNIWILALSLYSFIMMVKSTHHCQFLSVDNKVWIWLFLNSSSPFNPCRL